VLLANIKYCGGENMVIRFRRLEEPTGNTEYLIDYDFVDARNNPLQRTFYEKLKILYPKTARKKGTMSVLSVPTLEKAEKIYQLAIEHGANVRLWEAKLLKEHETKEKSGISMSVIGCTITDKDW
jgi:hypothetical protein